jgi:hypothetical protein
VGGGLGLSVGFDAVANDASASSEDTLATVGITTAAGLVIGFVVGSVIGVTRAQEARERALDTGFRRWMRERGFSVEP